MEDHDGDADLVIGLIKHGQLRRHAHRRHCGPALLPGRGVLLLPPFGWVSDAHRHEHVAVLVLGIGVLGAHLAGGLRVLELEAHFAFVAEGFEEVDDVGRVEADHDGVARVGRVDGVFALAGLGGVAN